MDYMIPPEKFRAWLDEIKSREIARFDKDAALLLGVTPKTISQMTINGVVGSAAYRTALAMAAVLAGVKPYNIEL